MFSIIIILIIITSSINSVIAISTNQNKTMNQLDINIDYGENDTLVLSYNITTNDSYFITFRSFGDKQLKFDLFLPTYKSEEHSIEISHQYKTTESFYLFIICFHFIRDINDLDIQCKDIRLLKKDQINSNLSKDFLPSYNPLFVPMMYALSIVMLLPVIIQHHRHKKAQLLQRRKQIRRLSITIAQDDQSPQQRLAKKILSHIVEDGDINYENIPLDIELVSMPSTNTILDANGDNPHVTFSLQNQQSFTQNNVDEESGINADDCIAHLLDNTPWNRPSTDHPFIKSSFRQTVVRDSARAIKEQYVPTIIPFHDDNDDDDDDQKPILNSNKHSIVNFHENNRTFLESDV